MTKRKPTALKKLAGNPGGRKLPPEPELPKDMPECPAHLSKAARAEWDRLARPLYDAGLLTIADRSVFAEYCALSARLEQAERQLARRGLTVQSPNGYRIANPLISICNRLAVNLRAYASEFGLSPASRAGVAGITPKRESLADQIWEDFIAGQPAK
ncbi:MAG: phage terminase small subunit P27 family [Anaerolineales bacterium]|nr:phage terminase small subunit P27 family [Anaerolineales bacterium]